MPAGDEDYRFNNDLLISADDQAWARRQYPEIAEALIFEALGDRFREADRVADEAKRRQHLLGVWAVYLVSGALVTASVTPYLRDWFGDDVVKPLSIPIALVSAAAGLAGVVCALANRRDRSWLQHRLVTERLRQLHFQLLIRLAPDLLAAARGGREQDWEAYKAVRLHALADFDIDVIGRKPDALADIVQPEDVGELSFHAPPPAAFAEPPAPVFWEAYRKLRIDRQQQYAAYKLRDDRKLISKFPIVQARTLGVAAVVCVVALILLHVLSAAAFIPPLDHLGEVLHLLAVCVAIAALALRVLEQGLMPHAEVERYLTYRRDTRRIIERFDAIVDSPDDDAAARTRKNAARLDCAKDLERASYDEMVSFLRTNHEASFLI